MFKVDENLTSGNSNEEGFISAHSLRKWSITVEKARTEFLVVEICVWISSDLHGLGSREDQRSYSFHAFLFYSSLPSPWNAASSMQGDARWITSRRVLVHSAARGMSAG